MIYSTCIIGFQYGLALLHFFIVVALRFSFCICIDERFFFTSSIQSLLLLLFLLLLWLISFLDWTICSKRVQIHTHTDTTKEEPKCGRCCAVSHISAKRMRLNHTQSRWLDLLFKFFSRFRILNRTHKYTRALTQSETNGTRRRRRRKTGQQTSRTYLSRYDSWLAIYTIR